MDNPSCLSTSVGHKIPTATQPKMREGARCLVFPLLPTSCVAISGIEETAQSKRTARCRSSTRGCTRWARRPTNSARTMPITSNVDPGPISLLENWITQRGTASVSELPSACRTNELEYRAYERAGPALKVHHGSAMTALRVTAFAICVIRDRLFERGDENSTVNASAGPATSANVAFAKAPTASERPSPIQ